MRNFFVIRNKLKSPRLLIRKFLGVAMLMSKSPVDYLCGLSITFLLSDFFSSIFSVLRWKIQISTAIIFVGTDGRRAWTTTRIEWKKGERNCRYLHNNKIPFALFSDDEEDKQKLFALNNGISRWTVAINRSTKGWGTMTLRNRRNFNCRNKYFFFHSSNVYRQYRPFGIRCGWNCLT